MERTVALNLNVKRGTLIEEVLEVIVVELGAQERIAMHCEDGLSSIADMSKDNPLPDVSGVRPWKFFSATV